jgi:hypothetical protein
MTALAGPSAFQKGNKRPLKRWASAFLVAATGAVLCLVLLCSFGFDYQNMAHGGSIDLRNRITGIRLLEKGVDPFHYKWRKGEPSEFCDLYNNLAVPVSKTTVTPAFLVLHRPLARLPYRSAQFDWLVFQWICLIGAGAVWLRACGTVRDRWLWVLLLTGFTFTCTWRLHAERGQSYVVLLFLLAGWLAQSRGDSRSGGFFGGLIAGALIALRPPLLLILVPFIAVRGRPQLGGALAGLAAGVGVPLLFDASCWQDYLGGMQQWSQLYRDGINPRPPLLDFPPVIEGMPTHVLGRFATIPFADSSFYYLLRKCCGINGLPALPFAALLASLVTLWFWLARRQPLDVVLVGIAAWSFLADFFLPALRNCYNDVLVLNIIGFGLAAGLRSGRWSLRLGLATLPAAWLILHKLPHSVWIINLPTLVYTLIAVLALVLPLIKRGEASPVAKPEQSEL